MLNITINPLLMIGMSFLLGLLMTFAVRSYATHRGFVAKPKSDRWHKRPTAMLGGAAIFLTTLILYAVFVQPSHDLAIVIGGSTVVIGGATFLFFVGLLDDIITIRPYQKLIGQLIGAGILVSFGLKMPLTGYDVVDAWLTVFWVVGITNAINLLDNMDGLAAGISAIAGISLALNFASNGDTNELLFISVFIGALLGFLVFNFNPASIFRGDCGSMFVGFLLSGSVLLNQSGGRSRGIFAILAVPVLILFVPIFDTTLVTVLRKLWGRSASQGGRDHTSHRLVALGLSERAAVLMLYGFAVFAGMLAYFVSRLAVTQSLAMIVAFSILLVIIGVYLSKVKVYGGQEDEKAIKENAAFAFLVNISHKRRIFEVFLDASLIMLSYYAAFALLFPQFENTANWDLFLRTLPMLILIKLGAFLIVGVYRGLWRYTSVDDLITFTKGVLLGSALSVLAILLIYRFQYFSRALFIIDGIILLLVLFGSRMAFRLIRQILPLPISGDGRRALIYGAGDAGEMVLRELKNNPAWNCNAVGFIDDDPLKTDTVIHGLKVFDGDGTLAELCQQHKINEILIAVREISPERLKVIREICSSGDIALKRAEMRIEPFDLV